MFVARFPLEASKSDIFLSVKVPSMIADRDLGKRNRTKTESADATASPGNQKGGPLDLLRYYAQRLWLNLRFGSSGNYWERRYRAGLNSGQGSYGNLAAYKAQFLNRFVEKYGVESVIEFGCGDGNQLALAHYPRYLGLDVSRTAIEICSRRFRDDASKSFLWYDPALTINPANFLQADLTLSLDVIYHLTEQHVYDKYLEDLFSVARRFTIVYSSDHDQPSSARHVRHRSFTRDVERRFASFRLVSSPANPLKAKTFASFFAFERVD